MSTISEMQKLATQGDRQAQYQLGLNLEKEKRISEACEWFEKLAEEDYVESQFKLGFYFCYGGADFSPSIEKAIYWLKKSSDKGHPQSQYHLGYLYNQHQEFEKAAFWFEKAAQQGEKRAMYSIALLHDNELLSESDLKTAVRYYTLLSDAVETEIIAENIDAMIKLGILYCEGTKIPRNANEGKRLIEKALMNNIGIQPQPFDCWQLGTLYCTGDINVNNEPQVEDLMTGIILLNLTIKDGLEGYPPGIISNAKGLRDVAQKRRNLIIETMSCIDGIKKLIGQEEENISDFLNQADKYISTLEEALFRDVYREEIIIDDLRVKKMQDELNRSGGIVNSNIMQTKKQTYFKTFEEWTDDITYTIRRTQKEDPQSSIIIRSAKCLNQVYKLRQIAQDFK